MLMRWIACRTRCAGGCEKSELEEMEREQHVRRIGWEWAIVPGKCHARGWCAPVAADRHWWWTGGGLGGGGGGGQWKVENLVRRRSEGYLRVWNPFKSLKARLSVQAVMRQACPCLWRPIQPATQLQLGSRPALASFKLSLGLGTDGASHSQVPWSMTALHLMF